MKLYLQIYRPEGKRVGYLKKDLRPFAGFVLYPDRPTEVPDEHATKILGSNKNLVGLEPWVPPVKVEPVSDSVPKPQEKRRREVLEEIASLEIGDLTVAEMNVYFQSLERKVPPPNVDKKRRAELLEKACESAFNEL